ncbi:arf-GAP with dual PH domain-containing protein 1 isoform X2 [Antennarius striatus]|uniref:arf-GAP with dual PH domain-containing protein 1 isoform X2 n=1 Tax=Antennarius striatus TaxID=241820 RepID=UPI0035B1A3FE
MANYEKNANIILKLAKQPENSRCADCGAHDPDWAVYRLGLFVCLNCSNTHRNLSNMVRSIKMDIWEDELVELMKSSGNASAQAFYERAVPAYYYRPRENDYIVLRDQWIKAKYDRMEFTEEPKNPPLPYTTGFHEGILWKKGKKNMRFLKRRFVLSQKAFTLSYFNKENEIVVWYNAIRAVRYAYLKSAYPTGSDEELIPKITRNYLKEGYMEKTGPLQNDLFRKRWFTLDSQKRTLFYFKGQLDAVELGVIFMGRESNGYTAKEHVPKHARGNKWKYGIKMETPTRQFVFMCEKESDQKEWLDALRQVIQRPMTPQDYNTEASIK